MRRVVEGCDCVRRILLSDISQGLVSDIHFPAGLKRVTLTEVVRSSKRVVAGAMKFQLKGEDEELLTRCHHDSEGPPLKSFLFSLSEGEDVFDLSGKFFPQRVEM